MPAVATRSSSGQDCGKLRRTRSSTSPTRASLGSPPCWSIAPTLPARTASRGRRPSTSTAPAAGGSSPRTALTTVDLPAPLGPSRATVWPGGWRGRGRRRRACRRSGRSVRRRRGQGSLGTPPSVAAPSGPGSSAGRRRPRSDIRQVRQDQWVAVQATQVAANGRSSSRSSGIAAPQPVAAAVGAGLDPRRGRRRSPRWCAAGRRCGAARPGRARTGRTRRARPRAGGRSRRAGPPAGRGSGPGGGGGGVDAGGHADLLGATREDAVTGEVARQEGAAATPEESGELRRGPVLAAAEDVESSQAAGAPVHRQREQHAAREGGGGRLSGSPAGSQGRHGTRTRPLPTTPFPDRRRCRNAGR